MVGISNKRGAGLDYEGLHHVGPVAGEQGAHITLVVPSAITGATYATHAYLPPASAGDRVAMPVVYALDGQSWFGPLAILAETTRRGMIVVALDGIQALPRFEVD